ncbi:hypothetical protein M9458_031576, partial [Cirrhinus mrigala]
VRFGRIPKREKQRMLLEMQTAMNNMMNNSQLQRMLHGTQTVPCAIDSSQSDSSSSSPSPPDSPRSSSDLSRDSESAVPMDTASSCSSDSGEEDAPSSGCVPREDLFAYASPPRGGSVSPASSETLSSSSKENEEPPRECWSRWNENGSAGNMHTTTGPYREHVNAYHVTQQCSRNPENLPYHRNNMNEVQTGGNRGHL